MDILVAEAKVVKHRTSDSPLQIGCLAPKTKILKVAFHALHLDMQSPCFPEIYDNAAFTSEGWERHVILAH
jgi:hypothetical protein